MELSRNTSPGGPAQVSIMRRLQLATLLLLTVFFGVLAILLVTAFRESAEAALRERLLSEVYGLLGAAEVSSGGRVKFPEQLPQYRFAQADSGLLGYVADGFGELLWTSPSAGQRKFLPIALLRKGEQRFDSLTEDGETWYWLTFAILWEDAPHRPRPLQFSVMENSRALDAEVGQFRGQVLRWLSALALLLLLVEGLILRWGLNPLGRAATEINGIKAGLREGLGAGYPVELAPLTESLNSLLQHQQQRLAHYRNALGDAAHSIKTPLAALRNSLAHGSSELEQLDLVDRSLEYHLKRAATAGPSAMSVPLAVEPLVKQLLNSLRKVYLGKPLEFSVQVEPGCRFPGDAGDFLEILGNLLDNACKWARKQVRCDIHGAWEEGRQLLIIEVADDGPGIAAEAREMIQQRGVHLDVGVSGEGIGLAVVRGITDSYHGELLIRQSEMGGALIHLRVPLV